MAAQTIAVTNHKGGVGKTTTSVNLAAGLAAYHAKRVLLIDFDPQSHATLALAYQPDQANEVPFSQILAQKGAPDAAAAIPKVTDCIVPTGIENLFLIPGDKELAISLPAHRFAALARAIEPVKAQLDYILIDTPPGLNVITTNALFAADWALVPCQQAIFSFDGLADLLEVIDEIANARPDVDPKQFYRILLTMVDGRLKRSHEYAARELEQYRDRLFESKIRRTDSLNQAQAAGLSIFHFDHTSLGAEDYHQLCNEVVATYESSPTAQPLSQQS